MSEQKSDGFLDLLLSSVQKLKEKCTSVFGNKTFGSMFCLDEAGCSRQNMDMSY